MTCGNLHHLQIAVAADGAHFLIGISFFFLNETLILKESNDFTPLLEFCHKAISYPKIGSPYYYMIIDYELYKAIKISFAYNMNQERAVIPISEPCKVAHFRKFTNNFTFS